MVEENKNITETNEDTGGVVEKTAETKETKETQEEKPNMNQDGTAAGPSKGFLKRIGDKLKGIKETEEGSEEKESEDEYGEEISPNFIEAAQHFKNPDGSVGWSEEKIIKYASDKTNEDLDASIDFLSEKKETKGTKEETKETKETEETKENTEEAETIESLSATLKETREELNSLKQGLGKVQEKDSLKEDAANLEMANEMFDSFSKSFPVFGKTKDIPKVPDGSNRVVPTDPAIKARSEVWDMALKLSKVDESLSFKDALTAACEIYEGKHYKDKVKDDVIKGLKEKSEQLTPKKSRKNVVKTYASEEDRKAAVVRNAAEKAGVSQD